ncbi:hypothetical protein scyTo_0008135, partial [Scyliorhinus torazame]|nr:hypothetical protein [Scyliorhinus torazame]
TNEDEIIEVLTSRTNFQRQQIIESFKSSYDQSLIEELKSELGGDFKSVIEGLMLTPGKFDAQELSNAMDGLGTDEHVLIEILATRTNKEIWSLADAYQSENASSLKESLKSENCGDFEEFLVSLLKAKRDEGYRVDESLANQDAKCRESDTLTFGLILHCMFLSSKALTGSVVFEEYYQITNKDIEDTIKDEMSGTFQMGMLALVQYAKNPASFFATKLYEAMSGAGTDDRSLTRIIITRCEVDMIDIKTEFLRLYGKSLYSFIEGDVGGDYRKTLLRLCGMDEDE